MLAILLCPQLLPVSYAQTSDTLSFLHITDTHIIDLSGYHTEIAERRKHYGQGVSPFVDFLTQAPKLHDASFIAHTGDMIDFFEGETPSESMRAGQIESFAKLLAHSSVPVYMILGNHDIKSNYNSAAPDYHSKPYYASDELARATWIQNVQCFKSGTYYSQTVKVDTVHYRLIFLDNSYYKDKKDRNSGVPFVTNLPQLYWLESQLSESNTDVEIIFMHMPLPWGNPAEAVSLLPAPDSRTFDLYSVLQRHSSVRLILTGHEHESALKDFQTRKGNKITQLMTGAFGRDHTNWRLIRLTKDGILISETGSAKTQKVILLR